MFCSILGSFVLLRRRKRRERRGDVCMMGIIAKG